LVFFGGVARETRAGVRVQGSEVRGTAAAARRRRGQGSEFRGQGNSRAAEQPGTFNANDANGAKGRKEDERL